MAHARIDVVERDDAVVGSPVLMLLRYRFASRTGCASQVRPRLSHAGTRRFFPAGYYPYWSSGLTQFRTTFPQPLRLRLAGDRTRSKACASMWGAYGFRSEHVGASYTDSCTRSTQCMACGSAKRATRDRRLTVTTWAGFTTAASTGNSSWKSTSNDLVQPALTPNTSLPSQRARSFPARAKRAHARTPSFVTCG